MAPRGPVERPPSELEIQREVQRLLTREIEDPSEDFVRFLCQRMSPPARRSPRLPEVCRRALRELARSRAHGPHRLDYRQQLSRRHREGGVLAGYYLG